MYGNQQFKILEDFCLKEFTFSSFFEMVIPTEEKFSSSLPEIEQHLLIELPNALHGGLYRTSQHL